MDAVRAVGGDYEIGPDDFAKDLAANIEIGVTLSFSEEDLELLHRKGIVSQYRRPEAWLQDFPGSSLPIPTINSPSPCPPTATGRIRYQDGVNKNNPYIREVFPKIYHVDTERRLDLYSRIFFFFAGRRNPTADAHRMLHVQPGEKMQLLFQLYRLNRAENPCPAGCVFETSKLLDYKLYQLNLDAFAKK